MVYACAAVTDGGDPTIGARVTCSSTNALGPVAAATEYVDTMTADGVVVGESTVEGVVVGADGGIVATTLGPMSAGEGPVDRAVGVAVATPTEIAAVAAIVPATTVVSVLRLIVNSLLDVGHLV